MAPWVAELIRDTTGVILGWALGLGSALLVDWRRERKTVTAIRIAISRELREVAYRLIGIVYTAEAHRGRLNREVLEWLRPHVERYAGPNPRDGLLAGVSGLLNRPDAELAQMTAYKRATSSPKFYPREDAPYTEAVVAQAHDFKPEYAVLVMDVLAHLRMYNEVRENELHYTRLTFVPGITEENHALAVGNAEQSEDQLSRRARIIVDKITQLEEKFG